MKELKNLRSRKRVILTCTYIFIACALITAAGIITTSLTENKISSLNNISPVKADASFEKAPPPAPPKPVTDYTLPPITNGMAPVISSIPTQQKVVFLTIDDGANKEPFELQMLQENKIKASLFLTDSSISNNRGFFNDYVNAGYPVEDHTVTHRNLRTLSLAEQKQEICNMADTQEKQYGRRPTLFRPPGGDYNADTQRAAAACGMKAIVLWIAKSNGQSMQYQVGASLRPGDIVLMHFRPEFRGDLRAFITAQDLAGLHTELLEDWLQ